ncbi:MAG TPA: deoxynucleoside kinase [Terriglobia bacterium]|nr:deoxynucleoside kinase [Terriglobia bacterium]
MSAGRNFESPRLIAIEGPMRVGKSSLAKLLAERLDAALLSDVEDNPFLDRFYREQPGSAFAAQLYFLMERFKQWRALDRGSPARRTIISDYLFEKDKIYAYLNLNDAELRLYEQYYALLAEQIPIPDLVIYLEAKPETLRVRIGRKNAPLEDKVSGEYLEELAQAYDHFFHHYKSSDLLVVATSEMDFVQREADFEELLNRLHQPVRGTQYFLPLRSASAD